MFGTARRGRCPILCLVREKHLVLGKRETSHLAFVFGTTGGVRRERDVSPHLPYKP